MNRVTSGRTAISNVFVFVLLGVFAVCSAFLVLVGARIYHSVIDQSHLLSNDRVFNSFLRTSVMTDDAQGVISVQELDGFCVLSFLNGNEEEAYIKRLYCYNGNLCELYTEYDEPFAPEEGEAICQASSFSATIENDMLLIGYTDQNQKDNSIRIALRANTLRE